MSDLNKLLPDPDTILALEPEDLAGLLVEFFHSIPKKDGGRTERQHTVMNTAFITGTQIVQGYEPKYHEPISQAFSEAWDWLLHQGVVVPRPLQGDPTGYVFSRRGQQLRTRADVAGYRERSKLPKELLHPIIADKAWPDFIKGEYETAVFQAFKEVEVAVRAAGGFSDTDLGTRLMRAAFDPVGGPLADASEPTSERESLAHLFAGAIGRFKNPSSHRHVTLDDPAMAFEMLVIASHLMRVVDDRKP